MPSPTKAPTKAPTTTPSPTPEHNPEIYPDTICPQQRREISSPDISP